MLTHGVFIVVGGVRPKEPQSGECSPLDSFLDGFVLYSPFNKSLGSVFSSSRPAVSGSHSFLREMSFCFVLSPLESKLACEEYGLREIWGDSPEV